MRIDIVIPCYNYGRYLRQCVESVLQQDGVEVRVLIIDDCSPDNTPAVGRSLAAGDSRVEYRRHEKNLRHIATYNEGFEWVTGDAVLLLSADDLISAGSLRRSADVLTREADAGLVWGGQIVFDEIPPAAPEAREWRYQFIRGTEFIRQMCLSGSNPVMTPTAVVRSSIVKALGGYDFQLPHTADMHYWLRCAARSSVAIIEADQAYKRMHGHNMQVEFVSRRVRDLDQQLLAFETFFEREGKVVRGANQLRMIARRSIADQAFWAANDAFEQGTASQCEELLMFAHKTDPNLPNTAMWSRLMIKRRMGRHVWKAVRPLVDRLRRGIRNPVGPVMA